MLNTVATREEPTQVVLDELPEGGSWVSLRANARQVEEETEDEKNVGWLADQVQFRLPAGRAEETAETVTAAFDGWWEYGAAWTPESDAPPSVLDRLAIMEETVNALIGM